MAALPQSPILAGHLSALRAKLPKDARVFQIVFLGTLLTTGVLLRDFTIRVEQVALVFAVALTTQMLWVRALGLANVGLLSAVVTSFGTSILVRADSLWVHPLLACLAISAKFVIRVNGKHLFNPANLAVIVAITLLPGAWISPGQWGNDLIFAAWFVILGGIVTQRATRWDIAWFFLAFFLGLIALRIAILGQSWAILLHHMKSGALLLFAFFMISDPMTIPNHRVMRFAYAAVVAILAFVWQFWLFKPNALVWALFLATPLVPLLDRMLPARKFEWRPGGQPPVAVQRLNAKNSDQGRAPA